MGRKFKSVICILMTAIMLATSAWVGCAAEKSSDSSVAFSETYSVSVPSYDGAVLISAELSGEDVQMTVQGKNKTCLLEIDVSDYISVDTFTRINLVYFKYSGKYAIYTGDVSQSPVYKTSGNDKITHDETASGVNAAYGLTLESVDFSSENGARLKGFGCYEIMRGTDNVTKLVSKDWSNEGANIGKLIPEIDSEALWHQGNSQTVTRDGEDWNVYENANYSRFAIAADPANGEKTALKMQVENGDQRLKYNISVGSVGHTDSNNLKLKFGIYLPNDNSTNATGQINLQAKSGYAYPVIKITKKSDGYAVTDAEGNTVFEKISAGWHSFELFFDIDAQKYIIYYDGSTSDSADRLGRLSSIVNTSDKNFLGARSFRALQLTASKASGSSKSVFYISNVYMGYFSASSLDNINFEKMYMRDLFVFDEEAMDAALKNIEILNSDNVKNGVTLDSVTGSGAFDKNLKTYENTYSVDWKSSNVSIISDTGVVHPSTVEAKTVKLTATAYDTSGNSKSREFSVTVPKVMPYEVYGVEVTGDDNTVDDRIVGGKAVTAVKLTRYAQAGNGAGVMIAALYDSGKLCSVSVKNLSEEAVAPYSDGKLVLDKALALPTVVNGDYSVRVFIFDNLTNLAPVSELFEIGAETNSATMYLCGDSTVAPYDASLYAPQLGWGEKIGEYLKDITVSNKAIPGKSARSFIAEGDIAALESMKSGDFVIVQFGHNDQAQQKPIQAASVNLTADKSAIDYTKSNSYVRYLQMYVDKAREKGASLIFVTSPNRAADKEPLPSNIGDYPTAMKLFAAEKGVPCVDLNTKTVELFNMNSMKDYYKNYFLVWGSSSDGKGYTKDYVIEKFGDIGSAYSNGESHLDYTHFNRDGAGVMANIVADGIDKLGNSLSRHIVTENIKSLDEIAQNPPKMPVQGTAGELKLTAISRANGVSLSWTALDSVSGYKVYRDSILIAEVTGTSYDDRYFRTVEDLRGETTNYANGITASNLKNEHEYRVVAGNVESNSVYRTAVVDKLVYFTMAGTTALDDKSSLGKPNSKGLRSAFSNSPYAMLRRGDATVQLNGEISGTTLYSYTGYKMNGTTIMPIAYFGDYAGKTAYGKVLGNLNYTQNSASDSSGGENVVGKTMTLWLAYNGGTTDGLAPSDATAYPKDSTENYTVLVNAALEETSKPYDLAKMGILGTAGSFTINGGISVVTENADANIAVSVSSDKKLSVTSFKGVDGKTLEGAARWATYIADVTTVKSGAGADAQISINDTNIANTSAYFNSNGERYGIHSITVVKTADYIK